MTNTSEQKKIMIKMHDLADKINDKPWGNSQLLEGEYNKYLNQLLDMGWSYALGKQREIHDSKMPSRYIKQRDEIIDELQIRLGDCAGRYRSSEEGTQEDHDSIKDYYDTFSELIMINGGLIGLDPDSELPDELMPKIYMDYW